MLKFSDEKYTYRLESPEAGNLYFDGVELKKVEVEQAGVGAAYNKKTI